MNHTSLISSTYAPRIFYKLFHLSSPKIDCIILSQEKYVLGFNWYGTWFWHWKYEILVWGFWWLVFVVWLSLGY